MRAKLLFILGLLVLLIACGTETSLEMYDDKANKSENESETVEDIPKRVVMEEGIEVRWGDDEEPLIPAPKAAGLFDGETEGEDDTGTVAGEDTVPEESDALNGTETNSSSDTKKLIEETEQLLRDSQRRLPNFNPDAFVHVLDVGYGQAIVIQMPNGDNVLVDCGPYSQSSFVLEYLDSLGIAELEALVLTSPRKEHVGGCDRILQYIHVEKIVHNGLNGRSRDYDQFMDTIEADSLRRIVLHAPYVLDSNDKTSLTIIPPYDSHKLITSLKDNSLLVRFVHGDVSFLIAGDCRRGCERALLEDYDPVDLLSTVYVVGDHGSEKAANPLFLEAVLPLVAIFSTQAGFDPEAPSLATLRRLRNLGSQIIRTDYDGTVVVKTDGDAYVTSITNGIEFIDPTGKFNTTFMPYDDCRYVAHVNSNIYYPMECSFAPDIEPQNRLCFPDGDVAFDFGFTEYNRCRID